MVGAPIRIVIADESQLYRETLCKAIEKEASLQVVAEAEDGLAAIQAAEKYRPDVVLMAIEMPVIDGFNATKIIDSRFPYTRVILLSMNSASIVTAVACHAGACCHLSKKCRPQKIFAAIKTVTTKGEICLFSLPFSHRLCS